MPGTIAPTSQLAWLISITAISVLSWSRAVRDRLKSLGCGIGVLHRFFPAAMVPPPRRPPHTILFEGADDLREEMTLLALVEPGMAASAQFRAFEPVEHEQRAFDPPQLLECEVELVLVGGRPRVFST